MRSTSPLPRRKTFRIAGGSPKPGERVASRNIALSGVSVYAPALAKNAIISSRIGGTSKMVTTPTKSPSLK